MDNIHNKVLKNFIWRFLERCGAQGVAFVVSIVLARMLGPTAYGTIALVTVFTTILQVFIDSGLGNALIQKKDADDLDFSSVFYFNLIMSLSLYAVMFAVAPLIATFYGMPDLSAIVRVLSLTLLVSGVKNIQQAYVSRTLQFKRFFFASLGGTVSAAIVGIWMAVCGCGVWALVAQHLVNAGMSTLLLWVTVKWRPKRLFSVQRLKKLFSFGWKLLVSGLLDTIYNDLRQLIIGKLYTAEDLAQYNKGKQFPHLVISNINSSIDSVLLPVMSERQDDREQVKSMTRRAIKTSTYIMAPMMIGMVCVAEPMIRLLLTEKWLPCVPYLRIFCVTYLFYPIHTANLNAIKALGRSDLFLKLEIAKKTVGLAVLFSTMRLGVMAMAYSLLFTSVTSQIINSWPNRKLLNYSYLSQLKDILPGVLLALIMGTCVSFVERFGFGDLLTLAIQIPLGVAIYIAGSAVLKLDAYVYSLGVVKYYVQKIRKQEM